MAKTLILLDSFIYMVLFIYLDFDPNFCIGTQVIFMFTLHTLSYTEVLAGFSNIGVGAYALLYAVAGGVEESRLFVDPGKRLLLKMKTEN